MGRTQRPPSLASEAWGERNLGKREALITAALCNSWLSPSISSLPFPFSLPVFIMFNFAGTWW